MSQLRKRNGVGCGGARGSCGRCGRAACRKVCGRANRVALEYAQQIGADRHELDARPDPLEEHADFGHVGAAHVNRVARAQFHACFPLLATLPLDTNVGTTGPKVAVTVVSLLSLTAHGLVEHPPPLKPLKTEPALGDAVSVGPLELE